jgi:hypothetical protein
MSSKTQVTPKTVDLLIKALDELAARGPVAAKKLGVAGYCDELTGSLTYERTGSETADLGIKCYVGRRDFPITINDEPADDKQQRTVSWFQVSANGVLEVTVLTCTKSPGTYRFRAWASSNA